MISNCDQLACVLPDLGFCTLQLYYIFSESVRVYAHTYIHKIIYFGEYMHIYAYIYTLRKCIIVQLCAYVSIYVCEKEIE